MAHKQVPPYIDHWMRCTVNSKVMLFKGINSHDRCDICQDITSISTGLNHSKHIIKMVKRRKTVTCNNVLGTFEAYLHYVQGFRTFFKIFRCDRQNGLQPIFIGQFQQDGDAPTPKNIQFVFLGPHAQTVTKMCLQTAKFSRLLQTSVKTVHKHRNSRSWTTEGIFFFIHSGVAIL